MENAKFTGIPKMSAFNVPFDWNELALRDWLQRLPGTELEKSCEQICGVLQALNRAGVDKKLHRLFLEEISAYVKLFENRVESIYLDSPIPLLDYQQHSVEWLVWCFLSLAKNFQQLADGSENNTTKGVMLYQSLFALAQAYQHMSAIYNEPCNGFWRMCYQVYSFAELEGLLDIEIEQEGQQNSSINRLFKLILVFSLCDYPQFRPREMRRIFAYLRQNDNQLEIFRQFNKEHSKGLFAIQLHNDRGPFNLAKEEQIQHDSSIRYIAPVKLAKNIYQSLQDDHSKPGAIKEINRVVLMRVIKTLGLAQIRKFKRMEAGHQISGIVGFANIRDYLRQGAVDEVQSKPQAHPIPGKPYEYDTSQFELVDEKDELAFLGFSNLKKKFANDEKINKILDASAGLSSKINVWNSEEHLPVDVDIDISDFTVLNSSAKGYGIGFSHLQEKVKVGDLFALVSEQKQRIELALIRRFLRLSDGQFNMGIELIGVATDVVLMKAEDKQTRAIFLPGIKALNQADTLVYSSGDFNVAEFVTIRKDNKDIPCRLAKHINSTSSVWQVELFYLQLEGADKI